MIRDHPKNFEAIADALRRLYARPYVAGLTDAEARLLPTRIGARVVAELPISGWMTDAGELDLFDALSHHQRGERTFEQLLADSTTRRISGFATPVASVDDLIGARRFADRDIDLRDLVQLEKIRDVQSRRETPVRPPGDRQRGLDP